MTGMLILQRRLNNSDGWRSVARFRVDDSPVVQKAADLLTTVAQVWWRVVVDDNQQQVMAVHDGRRWQAVAEELPAADAMPWWQPTVAAAIDKLRSARQAPDFSDTIPISTNHRKDLP